MVGGAFFSEAVGKRQSKASRSWPTVSKAGWHYGRSRSIVPSVGASGVGFSDRQPTWSSAMNGPEERKAQNGDLKRKTVPL